MILYKSIVRHNSETIVNFEFEDTCQYSWQNNLQQCTDISRKTFWKIRYNDSLRHFDLMI